MTTLQRMQAACAEVDRGDSRFRTFIEACADVADRMVAEVERVDGLTLDELTDEMRANSRRWFPELHDGAARGEYKLEWFYALGLGGEGGEVQNEIKKLFRGVGGDESKVPGELADVFTYLLLLAHEYGVDLVAAYIDKRDLNEKRWG